MLTWNFIKNLKHSNSLKRTDIVKIRRTIDRNLHNDDTDSLYGSNEYIYKDFYQDNNYMIIIECLDNGYKVAKIILDYINDHADRLDCQKDNLKNYTSKWKSKINNQSSISSYNTTKRAQIHVISIPESLSTLVEIRCNNVKKVVIQFHTWIQRMYPNGHKHRESERLEKEFIAARSPVQKVLKQLEKLHSKEKKANEELRQASIRHQNLSLDETTSAKSLNNAADNKEKKKTELDQIKNQIIAAENSLEEEQNVYRVKALEIYEDFRKFEEERLNQIRNILIQFSEAAFSPDQSDEEDEIYEELLLSLQKEQSTIEDLNFWAKTYHIKDDDLTHSKSKTKSNKFENEPTGKNTTDESPEAEEESNENKKSLSTSKKNKISKSAETNTIES